MKIWRVILISSFILCLHALSLAQSGCYETQRLKGIQLYNQGDYSAAYKNFETAKLCTDLPANNDLDSWMEKCIIVVRLSQRSLVFSAVGGEEQSVEVSTNAKTFRVGNTPDWCTVSQQGRMLYVSCDDNFDIAPREAKITITSGGKSVVLEITQQSADLEMEFVPDPVVFSSEMETQMVGVTTNASEWLIETTPSWLVAERKEDTLLLACSRNSTPNIRKAEVLIVASGQQFVLQVSQLPGDTLVVLDSKELVFPQQRSDTRIHVMSNMAGWTVESSDPWIEVVPKKDSIVVTALENTSVFSRHGYVKASLGSRTSEVPVHQMPYVSNFVMPESDLKCITEASQETILVTSIPSDLIVYVDDTMTMRTPFTCNVDYEHHSLRMGLERREYLFNDMQEEIVFAPGLRFAQITFTAPKNIGLRTGFISANTFGAYCHFQASRPLVKEFVTDSIMPDGYHFMVGPIYQPIQYVGIYAGVGVGFHNGAQTAGMPNINVDYEAGVMGFFKNATLSMGFRTTRWSLIDSRTTFVFGLGGYLKRYYDKDFGYCSSDSRPWWSLNIMTRPAQKGYGLMASDLGDEKLRTYIKAMYLQPEDTVKNLAATLGFLFTPVDGLIDITVGAGADFNVAGATRSYPNLEVELGFIFNLWRFPITVMLHEADLIHDRRLFVDFGIGFHFGNFHKSTYK